MPARPLGLWCCRLQCHGHDHPAIGFSKEQQELLVQTLAGIRSVLDEQGAELIGGHTMESRSATPVPASLADHPHGERRQPSITLAEIRAAAR